MVSSRSYLPRYLIYCCMPACLLACMHCTLCAVFDPSRTSWSFRQFKCIIRYAVNPPPYPSFALFAWTFQLKFDFVIDIHYFIKAMSNREKNIRDTELFFNWSLLFVLFFFSQESGITAKSYPLTVDTSQAIKMKPDSESTTENEDDAVNELTSNHKRYDYVESYRRRLISASDAEYRYKSLFLGMCAALMAFLFILAVFCASRRNDPKTIESEPMNSLPTNVLLSEVIAVRS